MLSLNLQGVKLRQISSRPTALDSGRRSITSKPSPNITTLPLRVVSNNFLQPPDHNVKDEKDYYNEGTTGVILSQQRLSKLLRGEQKERKVSGIAVSANFHLDPDCRLDRRASLQGKKSSGWTSAKNAPVGILKAQMSPKQKTFSLNTTANGTEATVMRTSNQSSNRQKTLSFTKGVCFTPTQNRASSQRKRTTRSRSVVDELKLWLDVKKDIKSTHISMKCPYIAEDLPEDEGPETRPSVLLSEIAAIRARKPMHEYNTWRRVSFIRKVNLLG
eukprot:TRINITY_DN7206_c0_g1_i6.p1 TRINITY_DN7206_c0_g1~~TRINITY_DN7206_c0_g1_i6.p1  ORF type:complete len:274 (-),score=16.99 TRINITY_DN7206_c0_g1_i6:232-1053(-)